MMNEQELEKEIQDKNLNAPRLTPAPIDAEIVDAYYHRVPNSAMTLCVLTLKNGFQVTGESAAVSIANFDELIGRKVAFDMARNKIWALAGYQLKSELMKEN